MAADVSSLHCTKCRTVLPVVIFNTGQTARCPRCNAKIMVDAFPALLQSRQESSASERLLTDTDASCFYHPDRKAFIVCNNCGRFLCALCDVHIGGRDLCPSCVAACHNQQPNAPVELGRHRVAYDSLALTLAIVPLLFTPLISFYLAIRYWSTPVSALPRSRLRWVLAIIFATAQVGLWGLHFYSKSF